MAFLSFLPAIASAVGGILGMASQGSANRANMELAKYAFSENERMWNMQNAYNTPTAQMERLKEAGLNPNLVYGNGQVVGNTTSHAPTFNAPDIKPTTSGQFVGDVGNQAMFAGTQLQYQKEQVELAKSQRQYQQQQMLESAARTAETWAREARSKFDLDLARELRRYSVEGAKANVSKVWSDIERNDMQNQVAQAELELMPLRKQLSEAQYNSLVMTTATAAWELQQEKEGRFLGKDIFSVLANQVVRKLRGEPNMFDNPRDLKKNLESELRVKENSKGSSYRGATDTSGNVGFSHRVPKGGV